MFCVGALFPVEFLMICRPEKFSWNEFLRQYLTNVHKCYLLMSCAYRCNYIQQGSGNLLWGWFERERSNVARKFLKYNLEICGFLCILPPVSGQAKWEFRRFEPHLIFRSITIHTTILEELKGMSPAAQNTIKYTESISQSVIIHLRKIELAIRN